jgi:hypothetical protein
VGGFLGGSSRKRPARLFVGSGKRGRKDRNSGLPVRPLARISRCRSEPLASGSCERRLSASGLRLDSWSEIVDLGRAVDVGINVARHTFRAMGGARRGMCCDGLCYGEMRMRGCFAGAENNIVDADWCDADRPLVKDCCPIAISRSHYSSRIAASRARLADAHCKCFSAGCGTRRGELSRWNMRRCHTHRMAGENRAPVG